jgi:non-ribosomal peptide synthetase component E (peptide arylation enzyme)
MPVNFGSTLRSPLSRQGRGQGEGWSKQTAIFDFSRSDTPREISYAALDAECDAVAAGLAARGLGRGDRVGSSR